MLLSPSEYILTDDRELGSFLDALLFPRNDTNSAWNDTTNCIYCTSVYYISLNLPLFNDGRYDRLFLWGRMMNMYLYILHIYNLSVVFPFTCSPQPQNSAHPSQHFQGVAFQAICTLVTFCFDWFEWSCVGGCEGVIELTRRMIDV